jgi:hypothetical protein
MAEVRVQTFRHSGKEARATQSPAHDLESVSHYQECGNLRTHRDKHAERTSAYACGTT